MKKLKTYENWLLNKFKKTEYNIGDYILVNTYKTDVPVSNVCKIVDIKDNMYGVKNGPNAVTIWWIFKNAISRKLTPEEVEDIEMDINVNKYNL